MPALEPNLFRQTSPASAASVAIFGGYGVFGARVARSLAARGAGCLRIIGRQQPEADRLAAELNAAAAQGTPGPHCGQEADWTDADRCRRAIGDAAVVVNCAGPFTEFRSLLLERCLELGRHYVDIGEGREHARGIAAWSSRFADKGLIAAYGCSSLPTVSCSLLWAAAEGLDDLPALGHEIASLRCVLYIGHDNPKGWGAVNGAAHQIGKPIETPQGTLYGFRDPASLDLPAPAGRKVARNYNSPEYDLAPRIVRLAAGASIRVQVGFELPLVNGLFGAAARLAPTCGRRLLPLLASASSFTRQLGSSAGAVFCEVGDIRGRHRQLVAWAPEDGQRLAALPAVFAVERILAVANRDEQLPPGVWAGFELLGAAELLRKLHAEGITIASRESDDPPGRWRDLFPAPSLTNPGALHGTQTEGASP